MSFPKHGSTKNSGVDWLGAVPKHWRVVPLKHIADFVNGAAFKPAEWAESGYPIIRIENLNGGENFNYFDGEPEHRYLVQNGALLFGWSGNRGTSFGPFRWSRDEVCVLNQHIFRVESHEMTTDELYWTLKAVTAHVEEQAHGIIGMVHITKGDLGSIKVPVPPPDEQEAIASFLDVETSKIDGLVSEQRRLIELLKEKRQAVISHAVTKGLNPNAPMKPSGIQWLGDVPKHWDAIRLKLLIEPGTSISYGIVQPGDPLEEGVPFVQTTNMTTGDFSLDSLQRTTSETAKQYPRSTLAGGEVLLGIRASIGAAHVVPEWLAGANLSRGVARIVPNEKIGAAYLVAFLRADVTFRYWGLSQQGSTFNEVSIATVRELSVAVPPPPEQAEITAFVVNESDKFDSLVAEAERAIELLQERRTALISAAVTGKIDVRAFAYQETA